MRIFAYICIWSTPFQIGFCLWALGIVLTSDATILSLTNDIFLSNYLPTLYQFVKPFTYIIFPDVFMDFIWSLPIVIHTLVKAVVSTWLGFWILQKLDSKETT
mgnify:FL=1